jgi:hypothetical protein
MARNIIGVIIGIAAAGMVVFFIQSVSSSLFPMPQDLNPSDTEAMKEYVATLPPLAFILLLLSHFFGALAGAAIGSKVASSQQFRISMFIGAFMLLMGVINLTMIPHPAWFMVADMFTYLPGAFIGYKVYERFMPNQAA